MPSVPLTTTLRTEYERLFNTCVIRSQRKDAVETILGKILANKDQYDAVQAQVGVPWYFVAAVHFRESTLSFSKHLHNGDSLNARTVRVPAGYPRTGQPPFTWDFSAADALTLKRLSSATDWSLASTLYQLEKYNGFGYRLYHPTVLSPYLWSYSNHWSAGKYVEDGDWDGAFDRDQCGAAVILRRLAERGDIAFPDQPAPAPDDEPVVVAYSTAKSTNPAIVTAVIQLQTWLNTFPGVFTAIDGVPGDSTSDAFKAVTGSYLPGDPRG